MKVDPPPTPMMPLTTAAEVNYARSWGVLMCQDNGLDEVSFTYAPRGKWSTEFRVTSEGFLTADVDYSQEMDEVEELQK